MPQFTICWGRFIEAPVSQAAGQSGLTLLDLGGETAGAFSGALDPKPMCELDLCRFCFVYHTNASLREPNLAANSLNGARSYSTFTTAVPGNPVSPWGGALIRKVRCYLCGLKGFT